MQFRRFENSYVLSLARGEEIVSSLHRFCKDHGIYLAAISGIGASDCIKIGLFEIETKTFHHYDLTGDHEITNLIGNVTTKEGQLYLHVHITVANRSFQVLGGHLVSAVVSGACEIFIHAIDGRIERTFNNTIGLNIMDLG